MKKALLFFFAIALTCSVFAQAKPKPKAKDTTVAAADTTVKPAVDPGTVPLLSINDLAVFEAQILGELPAKYTDVIRAWFRQRIAEKLKK